MPKGRPKGFDEQIVLERAMLTFWREGYNGASMSLLLKEMGISRQSLYDTYGDKRELFMKAIRFYTDREVGNLLELLGGPSPPRDRLLAVVDYFHAMSESPNPRGCLVGNSLISLKEDDAELAQVINDAFERTYQGLLQTVQSALANGAISSNLSPAVLTRGLQNALIGLAATAKATPPEGAREEALSSITNGLLAAHL